MKFHISLMIAIMAVIISGCASAPQAPVSLSAHAIGPQGGRIGVAMTSLPQQDTQVPGAGCLLCLAAASLANSSLTKHAKTLPYEDLPKIKDELAVLLRKKGSAVTVIEEPLDTKSLSNFNTKGNNIAEKDFTSLRGKYQVDKLLVVEIDAIGFIRTYSAYIPTSDPKGLLRGKGYLVDLNSNTYDWYSSVLVTKSTDGNWDEPPTFPGLTNAYFQALAVGKDKFVEPFTYGNTTPPPPKTAADSFLPSTSNQAAANGSVQ